MLSVVKKEKKQNVRIVLTYLADSCWSKNTDYCSLFIFPALHQQDITQETMQHYCSHKYTDRYKVMWKHDTSTLENLQK